MDHNIKIRTAEGTDAEAVAGLLHELGYPQDSVTTVENRIRVWAEKPDGAVFVAEGDDGVMGVIAVQVCHFFERDGTWARIVALVVSERAQRRGVGGRLVAAVEDFAAARGCSRVEVTSSDRRDDAHAFYRGHGYTDQAGLSSRFLRDLAGQENARVIASRT